MATEMGTEHSYQDYSTMEKAEQLLILLKETPDLAGQLWDPETRDSVLQMVGLTQEEVHSLLAEINDYQPPEALVLW